jgi:hypothetical protein
MPILVLIYQIKEWEFKLISISISLKFKSKDYEIDFLLSDWTKKKTHSRYT